MRLVRASSAARDDKHEDEDEDEDEDASMRRCARCLIKIAS